MEAVAADAAIPGVPVVVLSDVQRNLRKLLIIDLMFCHHLQKLPNHKAGLYSNTYLAPSVGKSVQAQAFPWNLQRAGGTACEVQLRRRRPRRGRGGTGGRRSCWG